MKKLSYFVALAALLMSASCQKEAIPTESSVKDPVFTAIISNDDTKTSLDLSTKKVSWNPDDEITITDAIDVSVTYKVSSIDAQGKATFEKKEGETGTLGTGPYTATYGQAPSTSQTYSAKVEELPMSAISETTNLTFTVSCGLLKVTLTQAGISISSIAVSDGTKTYTLTCSEAVTIAGGATFYIAVPAGTYTSFKFTESNGYESFRTPLSIAVEENHIKPVSSDFGPAYKENNHLYGYGSKVNGVCWAPVNCGYDAKHTYGLLYQWGRKVGGGYNTEGMQTATTATYGDDGYYTELDDARFYTAESSPCDWYTNATSKQLSAWPMDSGDTGYVEEKIANPCPDGWRVPTYEEFRALVGNSSSLVRNGWDSANKGCWFNGTTSASSGDGLFLPAAGRRFYSSGSCQSRGSNGRYWSSSVNESNGFYLNFDSSNARIDDSSRAYGCSVRCVQE